MYICAQTQKLEKLDKSLFVSHNRKEIFVSHGKWLHPLFDLEDFLQKHEYKPESLFLTDKIAGKAAAFLIVRLGIKKAHIKLISEGAVAVFKKHNIEITYDELVPQIQCRTEIIISEEMQVDEVWQILRRRAGRVSGVDLKIEKLQLKIDGKPLIDGLDLHVSKGEHIIIKGANGAGKTTLLKAILGLNRLELGTITIGEFNVGSHEWKKNRNISGFVNQEVVKGNFPISAFEVVEVGLAGRKIAQAEIRHRVEIAMRRTNCLHLAKRLFHELSGGEKQRVSIARCLCQEARLLLFDEPTSFLDAQSRNELYELLMHLWENEAPTVIIVSHDDQWIDRFNWTVYELLDGKLIKT